MSVFGLHVRVEACGDQGWHVERLADVGAAVTVLPATDLFVLARHRDYDVPRCITDANLFVANGCNCSISTNNILNPFTPFGDCSLVRMANLYANICQVGSRHDIRECLAMVTTRSAALARIADYGLAVGRSADLVVLDATEPEAAVAELAARIKEVRDAAAANGATAPMSTAPLSTAPLTIQVHTPQAGFMQRPGSAEEHRDHLGQLADAGVDSFVLRPPGDSISEAVEALHQYAQTFLKG